jgi:hypothetical protein
MRTGDGWLLLSKVHRTPLILAQKEIMCQRKCSIVIPERDYEYPVYNNGIFIVLKLYISE